MRTKFSYSFYLLSTALALLCFAELAVAAEPSQPADRALVGDFGPEIEPDSGLAEKVEDQGKLWADWNKRVAEAIYERFRKAAKVSFEHDAPLACQIKYIVSRDGWIGNVQVLQHSANAAFDNMLIAAIKSATGDKILQFPPGSQRQFVEKTGTFAWNFNGGHGFKGDFQPELIFDSVPSGRYRNGR